MSFLVGWLIVFVLFTLAAIEVGRHRRAQRYPDEFPYPRRRLIRRIAIALVFSGELVLVMYCPRGGPAVMLTTLGVLLLGLLVGFTLLWRDLRETSQAAVDHATTLSRQTGEALKSILSSKEGDPPPPRNGTDQRS